MTLKVKGQTHSVDVDGDTPLLWGARDVLGVTGTKFACGTAPYAQDALDWSCT
jgi:isoquinoline 1-oxidoreductase alpha subunit